MKIVNARQALKDRVWLAVALDVSRLGTCVRRQVGCVIIDRGGKVMSTGYNGPAPGQPHCVDSPCRGAGYPSGTGLELCEALHAEQNALSQCRAPMRVGAIYCTDSPCIHCVRLLASTSATRLVFSRPYPHPESEPYWRSLGRSWELVGEGGLRD